MRKLQEEYPEEKLVGFFYDPNIHPYSEYQLRLLDVKRSCKMLNIDLIEGEYDYEGWIKAVRGLENEPEKGARCDVCFDNRLENTAKEALKLGEKSITTTLLTSPKKSIEQLKAVGDSIYKKYSIEFVAPDFRKNGGTQEQFALAKEDMLYHQDYCGCIYALTAQRDQQKRLADELFSPISRQVQPESIEERIELYTKRIELEDQKIKYKIIREKFLNYRLLRGFVKQNGKVINSYFLSYSKTKRKLIKAKVAYEIEDKHFLNRENILFISLETFNNLLDYEYKSIDDLCLNPPSFEDEIEIRSKLIKTAFSLSPIIILTNVDNSAKYQIYCDSTSYEDVREILVTF